MYLSSNFPSLILYASIFLALLQIVQCTLRLTDLVPKASQLYTRMLTYGGNKTNVLQQIKKKAFERYPKTFSNYCKTYDENYQLNDFVLKSKLQLS